MKKTLLLILLFFFYTTTHSQSLKKLLQQGEEAMKEKNYFSAAQIYNQIILIDSSNINYQYLYAEASRLNYDLDIALHWYEKIYRQDNAKTFPETTYWMATLLKNKARYKEAKKLFSKFNQKNRNNKIKERKLLAERAKTESEACDLALVLMNKPLEIKVEHLDTNVNTKVSEYAPFENDTALLFSSLRKSEDRDSEHDLYFNKLYFSKKKENGFNKAIIGNDTINSKGIHTANSCLNSNQTKFYISRCSAIDASTFSCEIWCSEKINGIWQDFKKLPEEINKKGFNNTQPSTGIINGAEHLFFSSNRPGGEGGMDIWFCKITEEMSGLEIKNAGKNINTPGDEITPFFVSEKQMLYFSSMWHKGLGGFDIFRSEWRDGGFKNTENVGYPINSPLNDIYYSINTKKNTAYISSNRAGSYFEEKQSCCNDIYRFSIPPLAEPEKKIDSSMVILEQMKVLVPLTLFFHNDEPNPKTTAISTTKNYKTTYEEYNALKKKYTEEYPKGLNEKDKKIAENKIDLFFEDSVEAGMKDLEQFAILLKSVLEKKEKVKITMKGYCSPLASTDYNINLAKRRISSLENYFKEYQNGIFLKYINNKNENEGSINFFQEEIGELESSKVSDDLKDQRNSVYSPYAAAERKIQIIAISYLK